MARVLLTGGAGFIGSHIADQLLAEGHAVTIVDDLSSGFKANLPAGADFINVSILDPALEEIVRDGRFDCINHHAARIDVRESLQFPAAYAEANIGGTVQLLDYCRRYAVPEFVFASTGGAIYGDPASLPATEETLPAPLCPYGLSKWAAEQYIALYGRLHSLKYTIFRYPNVYGPRQNPFGEAGVNAIFIGAMLQGRVPRINGNGEQMRDYVFVGDVAEMNVRVLGRARNDVYHVATGVGRTVNDVYALLQEVVGFDQSAEHGPAKPGEVFKTYLSPDKTWNDWKWRARVDLKNGLEQTVDWFRHDGMSRFFEEV